MKQHIPESIFIDVNVFMYAAGKPHQYKGPCIQTLSDIKITSEDKDFDSIDFIQRIDPLNYKHLYEN